MSTKRKRYEETRQLFLRDITFLYKVLESCTNTRHLHACDSMVKIIHSKYKDKLSKFYLDMFAFTEYELRKQLVIERICVTRKP